MNRWHHAQHHAFHRERRHPVANDDPLQEPNRSQNDPSLTLNLLEPRVVNNPSTTPQVPSVAIALAVIVPIVIAVGVLVYLHRRNTKRLLAEDAHDKHGSLDFGMGEVSRKIRNKQGKVEPGMSTNDTEKMIRTGRGMSMDMGSPYVLPSDMEESRPSFQSLSRSAHDSEDPYRPVNFVKNDQSPSPSRLPSATPSRAQSTKTSNYTRTSFDQGGAMPLGRNLSPDDSTSAFRSDFSSPLTSPLTPPEPPKTVMRKPVATPLVKPPTPPADADDNIFAPEPTSNKEKDLAPLPTNDSVYGAIPTFNFTDDDQPDKNLPPTPPTAEKTPPPLQDSTLKAPEMNKSHQTWSTGPFDEWSTYADVLGIVQKQSDLSPEMNEYQPDPYPPDEYYTPLEEEPPAPTGLGVQGLDFDTRRLSASIRPLPPEDPTDNAEQRANRIRSFYREYFDDSKQDHGGHYGPEYYDGYYEDYGQEYLNGATIFDPETGQFIVAGAAPFAQPVTRRAMTPPPRAPPRFRPQGRRTGSAGQYSHQGRGPKAYSASGRPPPRGRARSKPLPPPAPLTNLPTPHLLKDDSAIFSAIDFAPPSTFRDRAAGRPASPFKEKRPYSPTVRPYTPLQSSMNDLTVMPSPHHLRKSGTFTALDFAPPPRFKSDTGSDSGSIRSGHSNKSAMTLHNIRAGAYRVSRLPTEMVGTKDDLTTSLKPTWGQRDGI